MKTSFLGLVLAGFASLVAAAQDEKRPESAKPAAKEVTPGEIDKLMEQLDANRFSERQTAQQKLAEVGKAALPALEKGTQSPSREVATRSLEVIKNHFQGEDDALKAAAKESLERLAKHQDAALAKRVSDILTP